MIPVLVILFFTSTLLLVWTYAGYPIFLNLFAPKKNSNATYGFDELPHIAIVMAAHNEEAVIQQKMKSLLNARYPKEKLHVYIGSDCSTDRTNEILSGYAAEDNRIHFTIYTERQGKPQILNQLVPAAQADIVVLTDANVFFDEELLVNLVRNFKDASIGLVGADVVNTGLRDAGISKQEDLYIRRETRIKFQEGTLFGTMIGPFGACYAIRRECFDTIPAGYIVDDFFLCMKVYEKKFRGIIDTDAKCFEDVSNDLKEEYRRKRRISIGNFQNFFQFSGLLFTRGFGFFISFLSHKVLRWFGPQLMIIAYISNLFLLNVHPFFDWSFLFQNLFYVLFIIDLLLDKADIHIKPLRLIRHFVSMNYALLAGFFIYLSGNHTATWKPTARNQ